MKRGRSANFGLAFNIALCKYVWMSSGSDLHPDPTLAVAERQLAMLGELAEMAMTAARAFTASATASAKAAEAILDDKYFMPEVGRANACGAKDAAESLQKVTRAVRLTLMLEMKVAEIARDIRAGIVTYSGGVSFRKDAGGTPADQDGLRVRQSLSRPSSGELAGSCSDDRDRHECDAERLIDIERLDILPRAAFRETVDRICADIGAVVDWSTWQVESADVRYEPPQPKPPGWSECRPPGVVQQSDRLDPEDREAVLPP